jgi:hypothetical protein
MDLFPLLALAQDLAQDPYLFRRQDRDQDLVRCSVPYSYQGILSLQMRYICSQHLLQTALAFAQAVHTHLTTSHRSINRTSTISMRTSVDATSMAQTQLVKTLSTCTRAYLLHKASYLRQYRAQKTF